MMVQSQGYHADSPEGRSLLLMKRLTGVLLAAFLAGAGAVSGIAPAMPVSGGARIQMDGGLLEARAASIDTSTLTFDVSRFRLPEGARSLVVVEGFAVKGGRDTYREGYVSDPGRWNRCRVTAFYRSSDDEPWKAVVQGPAVMGWSGMKNDRQAGDGSTPIGLFRMDTPFGRRPAEDGFPENYQEIMVGEKNQYWSSRTNRLEVDSDTSNHHGERLYEDWAKGIYSYCLNSGYNKNNAGGGSGSALFLHCTKPGKPSTAGCVAMDEEAMKGLLRLYAAGPAYCAQAPAGYFDAVYDAYTELGASPSGYFPSGAGEMPETETVVLY